MASHSQANPNVDPSSTLSSITVFYSSLEKPAPEGDAPLHRRLWSAHSTRGKNRTQKSNERQRRKLAIAKAAAEAAKADAEAAREQSLRATVRQASATLQLAQTERDLERAREDALRARCRARAAEEKFADLERKTVERDLISVRSRICSSTFLADSLRAGAPPS